MVGEDRTGERRVRVVFATDTPGHTAGYHVVARALRDAGIEVMLTGPQSPEATVTSAIEEDADLIAYRIMDRDPVAVVQALLAAKQEQDVVDIPVLIGGIIGKRDAALLRDAGVAGVFGPGSKLTAIVQSARDAVAPVGER